MPEYAYLDDGEFWDMMQDIENQSIAEYNRKQEAEERKKKREEARKKKSTK